MSSQQPTTTFFKGLGARFALKRESSLLIVALLVGASLVAPFYLSRPEKGPDGSRVWRLITTHDLPTLLIFIQQFDKVLRSGVAYPRWDPDVNNGYGTATGNFYPPGALYATSLIHAVVNDWIIALLVLCSLSLAASGVAFYVLSRAFFGKLASFIAALFYMLLPFHQMDLYWRGGVPQFVGYAFLPLILYFAFKLGSEGRLRYYAALGLCYGVYLMTHMPVGYLFTYVLALYAVLWSVKQRDLKIAARIAGGMAIGLVLSAIYWLPAALEGKYAYEWASGIFPYHLTYITMLPTSEPFSQHIQESLTYNVLVLIVAIIILRHIARSTVAHTEPGSASSPVINLQTQAQIKIWIILGVLTPFMSTSLSIHISRLIPKIQIAVPPFRWLAISCLFTSLLVAASIELLKERQRFEYKRKIAYSVALGSVIALNLWLTAHGVILGGLANPTHYPPPNFSDSGFIPRNSTLPDKLPDTPAVVVNPEGGAAEVIKWLPTLREVAVRLDQPSEVRLKTYNFPGWTARIDGESAPLGSDQDGVQVVLVPPGRHTIETEFVDTTPRKLGKVLFAVGLMLVAGLAVADFRTRTKTGAREHPAAGELTSKAAAKHKSKILIGALLAAVVVITGIFLTRARNPQSGTSAGDAGRSAASRPETPTQGNLQPNAEVGLYVSGSGTIPVAVDQQAFAELMNAFPASGERIEELVGSGKVFRVENNTRVRILEIGSARLKVRILEGQHVTLDGWVPDRWVR